MKKSFRKAMSLCVSLIMLFSILIPAGSVFAADAPKVALSIVDANGELVSVLNKNDEAYLRVEVSGISSVSSVRVKINNSNPEAAKFSTDFSEYKLRYQDVPNMKSDGVDILNIDNTDRDFGGVSLAADSVTLTLANNMSTAEPPSKRPPVAVSEFVMCDIPFDVIGDENSEVIFTFDKADTRVQLTDSVYSIYKIDAVKDLQAEPTDFKVAHNNPVIENIRFVVKETGADATIEDLSIRAAIEKYSRGEAVDINWNDYKVIASVYDKTLSESYCRYSEDYLYSSDGSQDSFVVEGWKSFAEGGKVDEVQNVTIKVIDNTKANNPTMSVQAKITPAEPANYIRLKENTVISVKSGTSEENAKKAVKEKEDLFEEVYTDGSAEPIDAKVADLTITDYFSNIYGTYNVEFDKTNILEGYDYDTDCTYTIKVYVDGSTGSGIQSGTVIGGGGGGAGGGGATPPKEEEPKDPETPDEPTTPVTPVEPVTPGVAPDMAADHWAAEAVKNLIDKGIVSGDTSGNIRPNDNITREEVAKIVAVAQGLTIEGDASNVTDSASVSDWAKPYVSAVVKAGAFSGNADGSFAPKVAITREQFAAVIVRAYGFGESTDELKFADAGELTWSKGLVAKAVELGIVTGYGDNSFRPGAQITRAEAFTMLTRAMNLKAALEEAAGIAPTE